VKRTKRIPILQALKEAGARVGLRLVRFGPAPMKECDMNHKKYMRAAIKSAYEGIAEKEGGPFGACIVRKGKVIAIAHNTVLRDNDPTCHAEINGIRAACQILKTPFLRGCTVYSTTEPCPMCFSAIHWAQCKNIVYGTAIEDVARLGFNELSIHNDTLIAMGRSPILIAAKNVLMPECQNLLLAWRKSNLKTY